MGARVAVLAAVIAGLGISAFAQQGAPAPPGDRLEAVEELRKQREETHEDAERNFARSEFYRFAALPGYEPTTYDEFLAGRAAANVSASQFPSRYEGWNAIRTTKPTPARLPDKGAETEAGARTNLVFGSSWVAMGPFRVDNGQPTFPNSSPRLVVSGRTSCLAADPTDPDTLYLGGAQGGVWKTTDAGQTWTPLTDQEASLAMGHIVIDPANPQRIWVGTGERHFSGDSYYGIGLLYSTDGGATWENRGAASGEFGFQYISRLALDRTDPTGQRVLVASSVGLIDTADGYQSSFLLRSAGEWSDIVQDPNDPTMWHAGRGGTGVYRSTNNGVTFTRVAGAPNTGASTAHRCHIAAHPGGGTPGTTILYALCLNSGSSITVYKSTDSGATWAAVPAPTASYNHGGQYSYDVYIAVSPTNSNHLSIGGVRCFTSADGGTTFTDSANGKNIHDDHHYGLFVVDGATTWQYDANDGGLFRSSDLGNSWTSLNAGLSLLQFTTLDISPDDENMVVGGTQDNGTNMFNGTGVWTHVRGGDGGHTLFDPSDANTIYGQYIRGVYYRSDNQGWEGSWGSISNGLNGGSTNNSTEFNFYAPLAISRANPDQLIIMGRTVWRTLDQGENFAAAGNPGSGQRGNAVCFAPSDGSVAYIGYNNGTVFRSVNVDDPSAAAVTWAAVTPPGAPTSAVQDIYVDPNDAAHVLVVYGQFNAGRVWETQNGLAVPPTWTQRTSDLPANVPVRQIVLDETDPLTWYAGTDFGVFRTINGGVNWQNYSTGLPRMAVYDMKIDPARNLLVVATHGRGAWRVTKPNVFVDALAVTNDVGGTPADGDGSLDAGERADLFVTLLNTGEEDAVAGSAISLTSTTPGVTVHAGTSPYATLTAGGGTAPNTVAFDIELAPEPAFAAGDRIDFELSFSSNGTAFERTLSFEMRVGVPLEFCPFLADFETGTDGFTAVVDTGSTNWTRDSVKSRSGSFAFHGFDVEPANLATLTSPTVAVPPAQLDVELSFWHTHYFEGNNWDGGVMELSLDGGPFVDIALPAAGVLGIVNGYTGTMQDATPLGSGREAFLNGGSGSPFRKTVLRLDPGVWSGHDLRARWRVASDDFVGPPAPSGWFIDDVSVCTRTWTSAVPVALTAFDLE